MHFPLFPRLLLLLPTLALCAPLATLLPGELIPTARDVYGDIYNIDTAVRELDKTVQSFQGGPLLPTLAEGVPMLAGGVEIHRVNRIGFWHAVASLPFSVQESTEIIDAVLNSGEFCFTPFFFVNKKSMEPGDRTAEQNWKHCIQGRVVDGAQLL